MKLGTDPQSQSKSPFQPQFQAQPQFAHEDAALFARSAMRGLETGAGARIVNRTHRVVRERAKVMQARRSRSRSLMLPLLICSALLILMFLAVWSLLDQYQVISPEAPDASNQFLVVLLWFVPVSTALLATVWISRTNKRADREAL